MIKMIQLYAKLFDINPTEGQQVKPVKYEKLADKSEFNMWHYMDWLDSIRLGIKNQVKLHPSGHIADGNFRYWCSRHLFEANNLNNYKWGFLPIDPYYFFGLQRIGEVFNIRKEIWDDLGTPRKRGELHNNKSLLSKHKVEDSRDSFPDIDQSKLGAGTHPFAQIRGLKFLNTSEMNMYGGLQT